MLGPTTPTRSTTCRRAAIYTGTYPESGNSLSKLDQAKKTHTTLPQRHADAGETETSRKNKAGEEGQGRPTPPNPDRHAITRRSPDATWTGSRTATEQERLSAPVESDHKACTYNAEIDRESYVAIGGYDTVAYWSLPSTTDKMPDGSTPMPAPAVKGKSEYAVNHGGHVWYFANEENMNKFKDSPNRHTFRRSAASAPGELPTRLVGLRRQWCIGAAARRSATSWYIKDGKLYFLLFYGLWDWLETEPVVNRVGARPVARHRERPVAPGALRQDSWRHLRDGAVMFDDDHLGPAAAARRSEGDTTRATCEMRDGSAPLRCRRPGAAVIGDIFVLDGVHELHAGTTGRSS